MENQRESRRESHQGAPRLRAHPKPQVSQVNSLNQAVRQELWYVDTVVASPFRTLRRQLQSSHGAWAQGADEALWAFEGMARLPIKLLQSAFGESLGAPPAAGEGAEHRESSS